VKKKSEILAPKNLSDIFIKDKGIRLTRQKSRVLEEE
jgi:hypothetical protein